VIHSEEEKRKHTKRKKRVVAKAGTEDVRELTCGEDLTAERNTRFHKFHTMKLENCCSGHPLIELLHCARHCHAQHHQCPLLLLWGRISDCAYLQQPREMPSQ